MFDFLQIRKSVDSLQLKINEIVVEQQQITGEINRLTSAPAARADMRQVVRDWIARSAADIAPVVAERMARRHGAGQLPSHDVGFFAALQGSSGTVTATQMDAAVCALFPGEIEKLLCGVVDTMAWPGEGLAQANRDAAIAKLQGREKKLSAEKAELLQSAREAGIDV